MSQIKPQNKQSISQVAPSIFSVLLSIIASSHHWIHMGILLILGSSTNVMVGMSEVLWIRRFMIVATLITALYTLIKLVKHKKAPVSMKLLNLFSIIISLGFIFYTLVTFGW